MKGVYLENLGCARRSLDTQRLARYFGRNGWRLASDPRRADLVVLTTCAYIREKADEALDAIERLNGPTGRLIVTGCLPDIEPGRLGAVFSGPTVPPSDLGAINGLFPEHRYRLEDILDSNHLWHGGGEEDDDPRLFVRIGRGCLGRCTFCAIRKATGPRTTGS